MIINYISRSDYYLLNLDKSKCAIKVYMYVIYLYYTFLFYFTCIIVYCIKKEIFFIYLLGKNILIKHTDEVDMNANDIEKVISVDPYKIILTFYIRNKC